jgi:hypothetical protein
VGFLNYNRDLKNPYNKFFSFLLKLGFLIGGFFLFIDPQMVIDFVLPLKPDDPLLSHYLARSFYALLIAGTYIASMVLTFVFGALAAALVYFTFIESFEND